MIWYGMVWYRIIWYDIVWYDVRKSVFSWLNHRIVTTTFSTRSYMEKEQTAYTSRVTIRI